MTDVFGLIEDTLAYDEPDQADFPDDLDLLLAVRHKLMEVGQAVRVLKKVADEKVGVLLGPGVKYEYGDSIVSFSRGFRWKPIPEAARAFIESTVDRDEILDLFPVTAIRKTGLEKVAARHNIDPRAAVDTVLEKVWGPAVVKMKPKAMEVADGEDEQA